MILNEDCIKGMNRLPDQYVDLIFADPPFNIGYIYDIYKDNKKYDEYLSWSKEWIAECYRILKQEGSIWVAIGDEFAAELKIILQDTGLRMRNWVIWYYGFGQSCRQKFNRCHTHLLYFVKSDQFTFNADPIRVPSDRQLKYKDKRANPLGKIPDDVWKISRVCGTFKERTGWHPCQMPEVILERIILSCSNENDIVLDPMFGSCVTGVVCEKYNRGFIGYEISKKYFKEADKRLNG